MKLSNLTNSTGVILIDGVLNAESEQLLNKSIDDAVQKGFNKVILDFRPVDHINSLGVSNLVKLTAIAKKKSIKLFAYGLSKRYRELFALTSLSDVINIMDDNEKSALLTGDEINNLKKMKVKSGKQSDAGWAPYIEKIKVTERPEGALVKNMDNRRPQGQIKGFGKMWQKTFWLMIDKPEFTPKDIIVKLMQNFVVFQIPENFFYPTSKGLTPGALVFIDSKTPGGIVSTGIYVLYVDDTSFTYITPQGHPEAGWITFSAKEEEGKIRLQIQGLVRASDPFYEIAYALAGQAFQEKIWLNVLTQMAKHLGIEDNGQMVKYKPANSCQWGKIGNIWYNAQIRTLPLNITKLVPLSRKVKEKASGGN
ncbi:MAG: STAS domain-containing protein [Dehalococcoidales bacterium]|nr:STAS domain-containing protein [Dehalococcoidales bacterium]